MTNILCICDHGQVRSVAMALILNEKGHNAIACSLKTFSEDFHSNLQQWSNFVLDMTENSFVKNNESNFRLCSAFNKKVIISKKPIISCWIGRDEWGNPNNEKLIAICKKKAEELHL